MTNKTYQQLLGEARVIVQDTDTDPTLQRYSDQTVLDAFNRGLQVLYKIRSDSFWDLWDDTVEDFVVPVITIDVATIPTSWLLPFALPMMFYDPLVSFIVAVLESVDDEFTDDSRSTAYMARFKAEVVGI